MSLSRLKLLQYHKVLMKTVGNTENSSEAILALDGIHEVNKYIVYCSHLCISN